LLDLGLCVTNFRACRLFCSNNKPPELKVAKTWRKKSTSTKNGEPMKIRNAGVIAAIALGSLVAFSNLATAQEGKKKGMPTVEQRMEQLDSALTLTAEQKPKVEGVVKETMKKMQDLRADTSLSSEDRRDKMSTIREDESKQMKAILTPEQFEKYKAMPRGGRGGGKKEGEKKD
jgi:hypothetical protein